MTIGGKTTILIRLSNLKQFDQKVNEKLASPRLIGSKDPMKQMKTYKTTPKQPQMKID
jgi:hypothetical protein